LQAEHKKLKFLLLAFSLKSITAVDESTAKAGKGDNINGRTDIVRDERHNLYTFDLLTHVTAE